MGLLGLYVLVTTVWAVWICSRNDAIGNLAVVLAAAGVFGTGTAWPDLVVAGIMATFGISGGFQIVRQARAELGYSRLVPMQQGGQLM